MINFGINIVTIPLPRAGAWTVILAAEI